MKEHRYMNNDGVAKGYHNLCVAILERTLEDIDIFAKQVEAKKSGKFNQDYYDKAEYSLIETKALVTENLDYLDTLCTLADVNKEWFIEIVTKKLKEVGKW